MAYSGTTPTPSLHYDTTEVAVVTASACVCSDHATAFDRVIELSGRQLTLALCSLFWLYVAWLFFSVHRQSLQTALGTFFKHKTGKNTLNNAIVSQPRPEGLAQLQTQFGALFCSMILADTCQA